MTAPDLEHAKAIALRLLRATDRSRSGLVERLVERDVAPAVAESAVHALERAGLVDDARLASELVARELSRGPTGRARLESKLRAVGVPDTIAAAALDEAYADRDPLPDAQAFARARLRAMPPRLDAAARARRLAAALSRRGFDPDTAERVVAEFVLDAAPSDPTDSDAMG